MNVGGRIVKMDRLRALLEDLGLTRVETFIASGNAIFSAPEPGPERLEVAIEKQLRDSLGFEVKTFVRTPEELGAVAAFEPFGAAAGAAEDTALYVAFLAATPDAEAERRLMEHAGPFDELRVEGREVYWRTHRKMSDSAFSGAVLEKALRMPSTMRNVTTVRKLAAKYCG